MDQELRFHTPNAEGIGSIPVAWLGQKKKQTHIFKI